MCRRGLLDGLWARCLLALVVVVAWSEAPVCTGGHAIDAACAAGASTARASFLFSTSACSPQLTAFASVGALRLGVPSAGSGRAMLCRPPQKLQQAIGPHWSVAPVGGHRCTLPLQSRVSATKLQISLTISGDDDENVKTDYRRADQDGTRVFISGLASSIDEKRLILALQSYQGVVEVKLAKPGLGFALFEDPASADVAIEDLEGVKLGGKVLTVRRARSFYIQQQQQATMQKEMDQRMREQSDMQPQYAPISPSPLDMRRASLSSNIHLPSRPGTPRARSGGMGAMDGPLPKIRAESAAMYRAAKEEERIRKQAVSEIMREGDVKISRRGRRVEGKLVNLPDLLPEEMAKSQPL